MPEPIEAPAAAEAQADAGAPSLLQAEPEAQAPEAQAPEAQSPAEGQEQEAREEQKQVPEKYEFEFPEGMKADTEAVESLSVVAKELGLTQEQAQAVAKVGIEMTLRQQQSHVKQVQAWTDEVKSDKDIGGAALNDSIATARAAAERFGTPELITVLDQTGLSNHPEVFRFFVKLGRATKDDNHVGGGQGQTSKSMAEIMYPSMHQKG